MVVVSIGVLVSVVLGMAIQGLVVQRYIERLSGFRREDGLGSWSPRAGVVLAMRGYDPFLPDLLQALFQQDYPAYEIFIVLDETGNASRSLIETTATRLGVTHVTVESLHDRSETCTLKCSAMIQAVTQLQCRCEVIAFIDSDIIPHRQWLRDLVQPLADPAVGASTGNRWYMSPQANWGSLVRYFWNAGAVVQMWLNNIAWGGSMALRTDVIRRVDLLSAWAQALSVDNTVSRQVRRHGYRVQFVPGAVAINTEHISLSQFLLWVRRQLVVTKARMTAWGMILTHGILMLSMLLVPVAMAMAALIAGDGSVAAISGLTGLTFTLANLVMTAALERAMRRIARLNGQRQPWLSPGVVCRLVPALLLTFVAYPYALMRASFCRRIFWRGIEYEVTGANQGRMVQYRPCGSAQCSDSAASVV